MELEELLGKHREVYVNHFQNQKKICDGASEALLEMKNEESEEIYRLYRFDCLGKNKDDSFEILEFNNDTYLDHMPIIFQDEELKIVLKPFFWNGCELYFDRNKNDFSEFIEWAKKWIDINDSNSKDTTKELTGLIHNVQRPELKQGEYCLAIDFGTSNTNSFMELFDVLKRMGIKSVRVESKSMLEEEK